MHSRSMVDHDFALRVAQMLAIRSDTECQGIFVDLLRRKQLSRTVHHHALLKNPEYAVVARTGLCRLGFPYDVAKNM